ncbi:helix-turn-helix domain-containing protein [Intestinimonas sp.]|uniref:helix-turn-helix domain-containing protein n=1 Tax=Intestinimonas sp. TaxID=1965293 RepID=UPI003AB51326
MTFGEKLQELLDWRGKSQSKVAELAEVSQSAISDYVNGRSTPSIDAARRIAKALDVSLWTLLNGEALAVVSMDLTERERRLVSGYRHLNDEQRAAVDQLLQAMGPDPK